MSNGTQPKPNFVVVFATVLVLLAFVVFVLAYGDLRTNHAALTLAGAMTAAIISVILFSIVPSSANPYLKLGVSFGGAALFFYTIYPKMEAAISRPPDLTISGGIYYQNDGKSQATLKPVARAKVKIPYTDQESETNDLGEFAIHHAPEGVKALFVVYKSLIYPVDLN
jgi:hypothetical protein